MFTDVWSLLHGGFNIEAKRLADLSQPCTSKLSSTALTNKLLYAPSHALNQAQGEEHDQLETLFRHLYNIKN